MTERMAESQKQLVLTMISPENVLNYSHGSSWKHPALPSAVDGEMKTHSAEFAMPFRRIVDGDLSIMRESIEQVALQMKVQFAQSVYGLMSETCERSGNTVDTKEAGGFAEAFERMLQKIEFGVDSKGNVSLPEIHVADAGPIIAALEGQTKEYGARIEALIKAKSESALAEEVIRKAKFEKQP
jgi:hypothetical protein